jgi:hypothetical protein
MYTAEQENASVLGVTALATKSLPLVCIDILSFTVCPSVPIIVLFTIIKDLFFFQEQLIYDIQCTRPFYNNQKKSS